MQRLESLAYPGAAAGMARFGIAGGWVLGIGIPALRAIAKETGKDQACMNLFRWTSHALTMAVAWSGLKEEFVKRAGFVLMATHASGDEEAADEDFAAFFPIILRESSDPRNFVKNAVNRALRQIGKRNPALNRMPIDCARTMQGFDSKSARWIAADALRELEGSAVQARLAGRGR